MSEFEFNDPCCFPHQENLTGIIMLEDGSLEVSTQTGPPRCSTAVFKCLKKGTKMLSISGPLDPGGNHFLFLDGPEYGSD